MKVTDLTPGVQQGDIIGPLLLNIYINDICDKFGCEHLLYADDLKIFSVINSLPDCQSQQSNLEKAKH